MAWLGHSGTRGDKRGQEGMPSYLSHRLGVDQVGNEPGAAPVERDIIGWNDHGRVRKKCEMFLHQSLQRMMVFSRSVLAFLDDDQPRQASSKCEEINYLSHAKHSPVCSVRYRGVFSTSAS
jgi:hypothetical protein